MTNKVHVAIAGGAGYTAGELLRLLLNHPQADLRAVISTTLAGKPFWESHRDLFGLTDQCFTDCLPQEDIDVLFLCLGHGLSRDFLAKNDTRRVAHIIDLSQDFRWQEQSLLPSAETTPERAFLYGLPESAPSPQQYACLAQEKGNIANPGCFATALQLALLPLAKSQMLTGEIHAQAITGATGAGVKPSATSHFPYRQDNISAYKAFEHQHLVEVGEQLEKWNGSRPTLYFVPMRGDFARGIFASIYTPCPLEQDAAFALYDTYFSAHPFVQVTPFALSMKEAVNTNKALVHVEKHGTMLHITCAIDNLLKGASGTAVQNMNLIMGLPQETGLQLKNIGY